MQNHRPVGAQLRIVIGRSRIGPEFQHAARHMMRAFGAAHLFQFRRIPDVQQQRALRHLVLRGGGIDARHDGIRGIKKIL